MTAFQLQHSHDSLLTWELVKWPMPADAAVPATSNTAISHTSIIDGLVVILDYVGSSLAAPPPHCITANSGIDPSRSLYLFTFDFHDFSRTVGQVGWEVRIYIFFCCLRRGSVCCDGIRVFYASCCHATAASTDFRQEERRKSAARRRRFGERTADWSRASGQNSAARCPIGSCGW